MKTVVGSSRPGSSNLFNHPGGMWILALLLGVQLACRPGAAPGPPPPRSPAAAKKVRVYTASDLLWKALRLYRSKDLPGADRTIRVLLINAPNHLEAHVVRAMIREAAGDKRAAKAWERVERILVFNGKQELFELEPALYAAARHYQRKGMAKRSELFIDELWRRFSAGEWSVRAQLMVARVAFEKKKWSEAEQACDVLTRLRPEHHLVSECRALVRKARHMTEGGNLTPDHARHWAWEHPLPQGNTLNDIWVSPDGQAFIVGDAGTILHRRKGHRGFALMKSPTRWALNGIWGTASNNVYAVGKAGIVLHHDGARWKIVRQASADHADLWTVYTSGAGQVTAAGDRGTVAWLEGGQWKVHRPAAVGLRGMAGTAGGELFVVGAGGLMINRRGGAWKTITSDSYEDLWSVWGSTRDNLIAVGNRKTIVRFDGKKAKEDVIGAGHFRDTWGFGARKAWVVGTRGEILRFTGSRWVREPSGTLVDLYGVAGHSEREIWAVGDGGTILKRTGRRWRLSSGGLKQKLVAVSLGHKKGRAYALGEMGLLLGRDRKGRWKTESSLPLPGRYRDLWSDGTRWYAAGDRGLLVTRKGKTWTRLTTNTPEDLRAIHGGEKSVVVVGTRGTILRVIGDRVTADPSPTGLDLRDVWGASDRHMVAVGNRGTVLRFDGDRWTAQPSGTLVDLNAVGGGSSDLIYAVGAKGTILSWSGHRWRTISSSLSQNLVGVWVSAPDRVFAISGRGGVEYFDGKAWSVHSSPTENLTAIHGDASTILAVGHCGTILRWVK